MKGIRLGLLLLLLPLPGFADDCSGNPVKTPRYNYNQVLYRLDLDAPALRAARPEDRAAAASLEVIRPSKDKTHFAQTTCAPPRAHCLHPLGWRCHSRCSKAVTRYNVTRYRWERKGRARIPGPQAPRAKPVPRSNGYSTGFSAVPARLVAFAHSVTAK